jgi:hypothetical protein
MKQHPIGVLFILMAAIAGFSASIQNFDRDRTGEPAAW